MDRPQRLTSAVLLLGVLAALAVHAKPPSELEKRFNRIRETITERHVDSPSDDALWRGAIDGMLRSLDPYSTYLDPNSLGRLQGRVKGNYSGIGIQLGVKNDRLTIISAFTGGPAADAGLKSGDQILSIDQESTDGFSTKKASERLRGKDGTEVTLRIRTPSEPARTRTVVLTRRKIKVEPVDGRLELVGDKRVAIVRLKTFQKDSAERLGESLETLAGEETPLDGVILDLRNNPGGLLSSAAKVAALFLDDGPIVTTVGRQRTVKKRYLAEDYRTGSDRYRERDLPLVILVNRGSASASEIVAGALQDRARGVLIGQRTFGKGSVQSIIKLDAGTAVKLTTSRYRLPSGRFIDGVGLLPDLEAERRRGDKDPSLRLALDVIRSWGRLRGRPTPAGAPPAS